MSAGGIGLRDVEGESAGGAGLLSAGRSESARLSGCRE